MANNQIQKYADMINLQMAAEAFWGNYFDVGTDKSIIVKEGNTVNSKEPDKIADLFKPGGRYTLVAHQDLSLNATTIGDIGTAGVNDKSGFSASVFWDNMKQEYTLAIRSTEFANVIKDPGDINAGLEIFDSGWAFAQINSVEKFWTSVLDGTAVNGQNGVTIPNDALRIGFAAAMNGNGRVNVRIKGVSIELFSRNKSLLTKPCHAALVSS